MSDNCPKCGGEFSVHYITGMMTCNGCGFTIHEVDYEYEYGWRKEEGD